MTRLMSFCTQPMVAANSAVDAPMNVTKPSAAGAYSISGDMRAIRNTPAVTIVAAWIKRGDRRRPLHRIRQPDMQAELRRLAHGADEQQEPDHLERREGRAEQRVGVRPVLRDGREDRRELERAELEEDQREADRERQIGDAVDDERLDRGGAGGRAVIPVADQQVGAQADTFPAEEQLRQIVGGHQHQHREGEQRQIGEEPVARAGLVRHVADRIDMDQHRDERHHRHHDRRQRVVAQCPVDVEPAGLDPGAEVEHGRTGRPPISSKHASGPQIAAITIPRIEAPIAARSPIAAGSRAGAGERSDGERVNHSTPGATPTTPTDQN